MHNALYWLEEFNLDGLRLDAVHAIVDDTRPDLLAELLSVVRDSPELSLDRKTEYTWDGKEWKSRPVGRTATPITPPGT